MRSITAALIACTTPLAAQQRDSSRADTLPRMVVTAERTPVTIQATSFAVTRIEASQLARFPNATIPEVLRLVPGFTFVDLDGHGRVPAPMVRGFYGGGEAEYLVVMIDGRPVNQLHTGLVAWDALPKLSAIEAIEIVRGSTSSSYGDAAVGGVINILTRDETRGPRYGLSVGSYGSLGIDGSFSAHPGDGTLSVSGSVERVGGYRDHSDARHAGARASWSTAPGGDAWLGLTLAGHDRDFDEPGPLIDALRNTDHRASDPLFRFDQTRDRDLLVGVDAAKQLSDAAQFSGSLSGEWRRTEGVRTLALAPGFGDTKERLASNRRWGAATQLDLGEARLSRGGRLSVGAELSHGRLGSTYYDVVTGDRDAYLESDGARGDLSADATATRLATALFAQYALAPHERVRLSLGLRGDWLRDSFNPRQPAQEVTSATRNRALSPSAGVNVAYLRNRTLTGNVYFTASRSFKAATLDQLFDQRSIPSPFPPFSVTVSNRLLRPQHGVNVEVGTYVTSSVTDQVRFELNLSAYNVDMKDELDFDVESFRYVNISRSRHRGIEAGVTASLPNGASAFASLSMQSAVSRSGEFAGKYLKAIPRQSSTAGLSLPLFRGLELAGMMTSASGMYLDDANVRKIPSYARVDFQIGYRLGDARLLLSARNVLDERYSSSGFPDPAGTGEPYWYPASGRVLEAGLRYGW